jgi:transposase, IS30 family
MLHMKYRTRIQYTEADKALMWERWRRGGSLNAIARALSRAPCTVSREIRRNGGRRSYRASEADKAAWHRAARPKRCKLAQNLALARVVAGKLQLEWSPYQAVTPAQGSVVACAWL